MERGRAVRRRRRAVLVAVAALVAAAAGTLLAVCANVATGGTARWFPAVERQPLGWTAGATVAVAGAALLAWWTQRRYERGLAVLVPAEQRPEPWVVDRPDEVEPIVAALCRRNGATVGITTALQGAGGFGKTTVAKLVRADRRVLRRFDGLVYWVTVGRDARRSALTEKVVELIRWVDPDRAVTFTDPRQASARQAGAYLAALLQTGPRRLIVLDDVWFSEQLDAFPIGGRCARLITTRQLSLVRDSRVLPVRVDQMSMTQARKVLLAELPALPETTVEGLLEETGRWPLLLRLVNKILLDQARLRHDLTTAAQELLARLRDGGALQVDQLTGAAGQGLDINDPAQRQQAVVATIEASTGLLTASERERLAELAIFAEDEAIPVELVTALWQATGGLDELDTVELCVRLEDLALLTLTRIESDGTVGMHDVVRDFLQNELGPARVCQLHQTLLDEVAADLPVAPPAASVAGGTADVVAWWQLPESARYLWDHVVEHLLAADRGAAAEALAVDLRWVGARLEQSGPAGPSTDLSTVDTPTTSRLRRLLGQTAHLLTPTEPTHSRIDILYSRVAHDPDWGQQVQRLAHDRTLPALCNRWPLPDLPHPALLRRLTGHTRWVRAVAIAPDSSWLATVGDDATVRIWDVASGQQQALLTSHTRWVWAVAIAPDGGWLATVGDDATVRTWDVASGQQRALLTGHSGSVWAVAIAPGGRWLATVGRDGTVRIWDVASGVDSAMTRVEQAVTACSWSPRGSALVVGGDGGLYQFAFNV
jgi:hypothetical protein